MKILFIITVAYLFGSIPFALLVGKLRHGIDVREHGSGNLGTTNAFRVLGKTSGFLVAFGDVLKGTLAASLPFLFVADLHQLLAGLAAVIGHMFPVFAKFKGGKAVATAGGVVLWYSPLLFVTSVTFFLVMIYLSKYVSLASMLVGIYASLFSWFVYHDTYLTAIVGLFTVLIFYRHRENMKRIINKTEPKVSWR